MKALKITYTAFLCCITFFTVDAQNLTAFHNYRDYFCVFDNGLIKLVEYLPVESYQIGGNAIAYIDNFYNLKVYNEGKIIKLNVGLNIKYFATDYLVAYSVAKQLYVFDNKRIKTLSYWVDCYGVSDSLIAFFDHYGYTFNIYYKGEIFILEDAMDEHSVKEFKTGDNILAYINYNNYFKIFYMGKTTSVMLLDEPLIYDAGKNIVAYIDELTFTFKVFYKGNFYELETFHPNSFQIGDDMVAYLDNTNYLKVFYDNKTITIILYEPVFYYVFDSILISSDKEYFNVFYKGKKYVLENYIPDSYQVDYSSIAYIDELGRLKVFYKGKTKILTSFEELNDYKLSRNTVWYNLDVNTNKVFNNGKIY